MYIFTKGWKLCCENTFLVSNLSHSAEQFLNLYIPLEKSSHTPDLSTFNRLPAFHGEEFILFLPWNQQLTLTRTCIYWFPVLPLVGLSIPKVTGDFIPLSVDRFVFILTPTFTTSPLLLPYAFDVNMTGLVTWAPLVQGLKSSLHSFSYFPLTLKKLQVVLHIHHSPESAFYCYLPPVDCQIIVQFLSSVTFPTFYFFYPHSRTFIHCFLRDREKEREALMWERNISWLPSHMHPDQRLNPQPGYMHPDWESNPWSFGLSDNIPTNWDNRPGFQHFILQIQLPSCTAKPLVCPGNTIMTLLPLNPEIPH